MLKDQTAMNKSHKNLEDSALKKYKILWRTWKEDLNI